MSRPEHFSVSQLAMAQKCGTQYEFRYVKGIKAPPGVVMIRGRSVHGGVELNHRQKIESKVDLPVAEVVETTADLVDTNFAGGDVALTPEEHEQGIDVVRGQIKDVSVTLASLYMVGDAKNPAIAPTVQPTAVETKIKATYHDVPLPVLGYLDVIDDKGIIRDAKTKSKSPPKNAAHESQQFTSYAMLYWSMFGKLPTAIVGDNLVVTDAGNTKIVMQPTQRELTDFVPLQARMRQTMEALDREVYVPANPEDWWCSERWCGYWNQCPFADRRDRPTT